MAVESTHQANPVILKRMASPFATCLLLVGIVPLLVSAGPSFFMGLPAAERIFDDDRRSVVRCSDLGS